MLKARKTAQLARRFFVLGRRFVGSSGGRGLNRPTNITGTDLTAMSARRTDRRPPDTGESHNPARDDAPRTK
ncbi:hypothetical protein [Paraburkholderia dilworthii]|uniref:Uncharacterized protein n=1 Tax=Paraburkholderia dilworthii TaxID=948106 RepID=A0ABW9DAX8_9BURK